MSRPLVSIFRRITYLALAAGSLASASAQSPPPDAVEQQRVLRSVTEFARNYLEHLPDFTCTRRAEHFQSKPGQDWQFQVRTAEELSYYGRAEHYKMVEVNGAPAKKPPFAVMAGGYYASAGNFGQLVGELFDPRAQAEFQWSGWEDLRGKRALVFGYRVAVDHSETRTGRCVSWILFQKCSSVKFGYHGLLYVDRDGGRIMRITQVAENVPAPYPSANDSVDYDLVAVAGEEYLLPVADEAQSLTGKTHFRNRSTYGDYRKFVAESTMMTGALPPAPAVRAGRPATSAEEAPVAGHCFDLRDQAAGKKTSHLRAGALAAAFNDPRKAEAELQAAIRTATEPEDAAAARGLLAAMYARAGEERRALAEIDAVIAQQSDDDPDGALRDTRARVAALAQFPPQSVAARGLSRLPYARREDHLSIPFSMNGKTAQFGMDTGASISAVSESAARALGMEVRDQRFEMMDAAGQKLPCRVALAAEMAVGRFQLRNVAFCALPDDQPGFADVPEMERGLIGLPVLLAFGTMRWTGDGSLEIGTPPARRDLAKSNLCLDGGIPVLQADFGSSRLRLALDTGNPETFLFNEFAADFPDAVKAAAAAEGHELQGLGESITVASRKLPRLDLRVAGRAVSLESVPVLMQPATGECLSCAGNAGLDLFDHVRQVTLDFQAMRLTLEP